MGSHVVSGTAEPGDFLFLIFLVLIWGYFFSLIFPIQFSLSKFCSLLTLYLFERKGYYIYFLVQRREGVALWKTCLGLQIEIGRRYNKGRGLCSKCQWKRKNFFGGFLNETRDRHEHWSGSTPTRHNLQEFGNSFIYCSIELFIFSPL